MMVQSLAAALLEAASRHGVRLSVATTARAALDHDQASVPMVRLSDQGDGATVRMLRGPLPHEGGMLQAHSVDATVEQGRLRPRTLAWIDEWTMGMATIQRFGEALAAAGCQPEALPPWGIRLDAAFVALAVADGKDPVDTISRLGWSPNDKGFEQKGPWYTASRYLDRITVTSSSMEIDGREVRFHDHGHEIGVWIKTSDVFPHTVLQAAAGLPIGDIVTLPGGTRISNIIKAVEYDDDFLVITAEPSTVLFRIPAAKEAK